MIPVAGQLIKPLNRSGRCFHFLFTDVPESVPRTPLFNKSAGLPGVNNSRIARCKQFAQGKK
jgi:hypothetical protein